MPLPLILLGVGAAFVVKAACDSSDANDINKEANDIVEKAKMKAEKARRSCGMDLEKLGSTKMSILNSSVKHFVRSFGELKNVNFRGSEGLNEMNRLGLSSGELAELRQMGDFASSVLGGVAGGTLGGALTAYGAYSAAGWVACASTGTAISSLSGAAATNATLAFFGGGSLATGGLGIAGGTAVLGGLVAGPALAIMGLIVGSKASAAKDEAYSNLAKAKKISEELNLVVDLSTAISKKCFLFTHLLDRLNAYFVPMIAKMERAIEQYGPDYSKFTQTQQEATAIAVSLAKAIKMVLDTPILDKNGNMTSISDDVLKRIKPVDLANGDDSCLLN